MSLSVIARSRFKNKIEVTIDILTTINIIKREIRDEEINETKRYTLSAMRRKCF
jgi:hypothetical protein